MEENEPKIPYSPGLAGVPAAESSICDIDGQKGILFYRGYSIEELAEKSTFEETAYLYDEVEPDYRPLPLPNDEAIQAALDRDFEVPVHNLKASDFYDSSFLQEIDRGGLLTSLYR